MPHDQLIGKYQRLRQELALAYEASTWDSRHVDRLANEIVAIETQMARARLPRSPSGRLGSGRADVGGDVDASRATSH